eukprot:5195078-Pyramimonas_sp.AAC.1
MSAMLVLPVVACAANTVTTGGAGDISPTASTAAARSPAADMLPGKPPWRVREAMISTSISIF